MHVPDHPFYLIIFLKIQLILHWILNKLWEPRSRLLTRMRRRSRTRLRIFASMFFVFSFFVFSFFRFSGGIDIKRTTIDDRDIMIAENPAWNNGPRESNFFSPRIRIVRPMMKYSIVPRPTSQIRRPPLPWVWGEGMVAGGGEGDTKSSTSYRPGPPSPLVTGGPRHKVGRHKNEIKC